MKLLKRIRPFLNLSATKAIYKGMTYLTYCGILYLNINKSRKEKLSSFHDGAMNITAFNTPQDDVSISVNEVKACRFVRRNMDGNVCLNFATYFVKRDHNVESRNNGYQLQLSKIRLEYTRSSLLLYES